MPKNSLQENCSEEFLFAFIVMKGDFMLKWEKDGYYIHIYPSKKACSPLIYVLGNHGNFETLSNPNYHLVVLEGINWHRDLTPWPIGPLFKKDLPYEGQAYQFLNWMMQEVVKPVEEMLDDRVIWRGLVGYSLAGLFSLYALYQTNYFKRVASVSGSLWYPGWLEYVQTHSMCIQPEKICLSLGNQEHHTRHPMMKEVKKCTEEFIRLMECPVIFQSQPGNHFDQVNERIQKAIDLLL